MARSARVIGILLLSAGALSCVPDEPTTESTGSAPGLVAVARPDLQPFEPLERNLLETSRAVVDSLGARPGASKEALATAYGELGRIYHAYHLLAPARDAYRNARRLDPGAFEWPYYLGQALRELGEREAAREAFEAALEIRPDEAAARSALAALSGGPAEAVDDPWMAALAERRTRAYAGLVVGEAAMARSDFEAATRAYREVVESAPDDVRGWQSLGTSLYRSGDSAGAIEAFLRAAEITPSDVRTRFNLGTLFARQGNDERAVEQYRLALAVDPSQSSARFNLGNALRRLGRPAEAAAEFRAIVESQPGEETARLAEAVSLVESGRPADAAKRIAEGLRALPHSAVLAEASVRLAATSAEPSVRDPARALRLAEQLVAREASVRHLESLAMALAASGQMERAIATQQRSIEAAQRQGAVEVLDRLRSNLEGYRRGEPCRDPGLG